MKTLILAYLSDSQNLLLEPISSRIPSGPLEYAYLILPRSTLIGKVTSHSYNKAIYRNT